MELINSFVISIGIAYTLLKLDTPYSSSVRAIISSCICALVYDVVFRNVKPIGIKPNSFRNVKGPGLSYLALVPIAFLVSLPLHTIESNTTLVVHLVVCIVTMSILHQFMLLLYLNTAPTQRRIKTWHVVAALPWLLTLLVQLAHASLQLGYTMAIVMYLCIAIACCGQWLFAHVVPLSFTLSEGAIVFQAVFLFSFQMFKMLTALLSNNIDELILYRKIDIFTNVAVLSIGVVFLLLGIFAKLRTSLLFYVTVAFVAVFVSLPLLLISLKQNFVVWMFIFITSDSKRAFLFSIWSAICLLCIAMVTVIHWIKSNSQARPDYRAGGEGMNIQLQNRILQNVSTSERKLFHIVAIGAFVPGLQLDISLMNCAATCAVVVFSVLECMRIVHVKPFGTILDKYLELFRDKQDKGELILTPIFLLTGFTLPLWLRQQYHVTLEFYSGVISLGVGDTASAVIGSKLGHTKWPNSSRSVQGTAAFIISCVVFVACLYCMNIRIEQSWLDILLGVVFTALAEAFTSQIDNLVLPLFMYIMLAC